MNKDYMTRMTGGGGEGGPAPKCIFLNNVQLNTAPFTNNMTFTFS